MMRTHPHFHVRARVSAGLEPFPARTIGKRLLDRAVLFAGIVAPVLTLPQVIAIYGTGNASGVSALSWGAFALFDIPWIMYGIVHRERPIVITYSLWLFFNALVCIGALMY